MAPPNAQALIDYVTVSEDIDGASGELLRWVGAGRGHEVSSLLEELLDLPGSELADASAVERLIARTELVLISSRDRRLYGPLLDHLRSQSTRGRVDAELRARRLAFYFSASLGKYLVLRLFEEESHDYRLLDFFGALLHEMIIRGYPCRRERAMASVLECLRAARHPLAILPAERLGIESRIPAPIYHHAVRYDHRTFPLLSRESSADIEEPLAPPPWREYHDAAARMRIASAIKHHQDRGAFNMEARVYNFSEGVAAESLSPFFLQLLQPQCLADAESGGTSLLRVEAAEALGIMFSASAWSEHGIDGNFGALSRLRLWESMAGLTGVDLNAGVRAVAERAENCYWACFRAENQWFTDPETDLGILCLREDRRHLALLAAGRV